MLENKGQINHAIPIPLYFQLKELILNEIRSGNYKSGDMIPTELEMSEMFGLSRTTIRQATAELVQEGWLIKIKSKGTFVSMPRIPQDFVNKLESYDDSIRAQGMEPSTQVLEMNVISVSEAGAPVRKNLKLRDADKVIYLYRKRCADGNPIVLVQTYLPYSNCREILEHDFAREKLYSVLALSEKTRIFRVERVMEAIEADSQTARLLSIKKGKALQHFESVGYNAFGEPVEYSLAYYRGDRSRFNVTVFPEEEKQPEMPENQ